MEESRINTPAGGENRFRRDKYKNLFLKIAALVVVLAGIGMLAYPFLPALSYKMSKPADFYPYETKLLNNNLYIGSLPEIKEAAKEAVKEPKKIPSDNRLVIPKIGVDVSIVEGKNENSSLLKGAWHIPGTQNPATGGNMVISGHRFRYRPPNNTTFYLLDKLSAGDTFIIYWQGVEYDYQVAQTKVVAPTAVEILNNTPNSQVTLYTCTPLFTTKQRLVVIGTPINT